MQVRYYRAQKFTAQPVGLTLSGPIAERLGARQAANLKPVPCKSGVPELLCAIVQLLPIGLIW